MHVNHSQTSEIVIPVLPRDDGTRWARLSVGHAAFAATLVGLGLLGLIKGDFAPIWQPVPRATPAREVLVYLCVCICLGCGIAVLWQRTSVVAARILLAYLLLWMILFRIPVILHAPAVEVSWEGCGETAVLVAGAWALRAQNGVRFARILYGLALIPLGLAHLVYVKDTAALVPSWLPSHEAWAYFTGSTYLAAGAAILIGVGARLAATLSAAQMGVFTLLVWLPMLIAGHREAFVWSESIVSWSLTAAAWVVADSYQGARWLAVELWKGTSK
jgi:uncharacterized membrane protein